MREEGRHEMEEGKRRNGIVYTHGPKIHLRTLGGGVGAVRGNGEICDTRTKGGINTFNRR